MISRILPVCLVALSSGCSLIGGKPYVPETKAVEVVTVSKQAVVYHPPMPNPIMTKPVEWKVLTPDTMGEYLEDLEKGEAPTNVCKHERDQTLLASNVFNNYLLSGVER